MKKAASIVLAFVLMAGAFLPFPSAAHAATIQSSTTYPVSVTLDSHGVSPVGGSYFFTSGQQISLSVGWNNVDNIPTNATCINESEISMKVGDQWALFTENIDPNNSSNYAPVFHYTVKDTDLSGLLAMDTGPNWCGEGDSLWNPYGETRYSDGTLVNNDAYFRSLYPYTIYIDNSAPVVTFGKSSDTTYKKSHNVTITATDAPVNSNLQLYYTWSQSDTAPLASDINTNILNGAPAADPTGTGTYYLYARAVDVVGHTTIAKAGPFNFDNQAPDVTISPQYGSAAQSHTVTYSASDAQSGIKQIDYEWDKDGAYYSGGSGAGGTLSVPNSLEGSYRLKVRATDNAGNVTESDSLDYIIDKSPPTATFSSEGSSAPAASSQVDVTLLEAKGTLGQAFYQWTDSPGSPAADDSGWQQFFNGSGH